jgi:hypothetical protein
VLDRAARGRDPDPLGVRVERRALGHVHARHGAVVEPVAREPERRALAHVEVERAAPEVARRVDVVGEHEQVVERRHR